MERNNYLGTERVGKLLLQFAIPSTLALIISCLYNIVDQIFVGNGIGYLGNAATGIVFPITVVGWGASVLFGDGMATFLSLSQGQGEHLRGRALCRQQYLGVVLLRRGDHRCLLRFGRQPSLNAGRHRGNHRTDA